MYINPLMGLQMWEGNEPTTDARTRKTIVWCGAPILPTRRFRTGTCLVKEAMHRAGFPTGVIDPVYTRSPQES